MIEEYYSYIDHAGQSFTTWARPDGWVEPPHKNWPLVDFRSATNVAFGYLLFVFLASLIMKFLPPIGGLYPLKFVYNIIQIMLCSYMCIEAGIRAYFAGYSIIPCNPFNQEQPVMGFILYVFYLSKILDFLDTVFIILEKRWSQLSFLHVYHHFSVFLSYWININIGYDGEVYVTIVLNGFIHTIMYTYYLISMHTRDIWWKSSLTSLQIIQFMIMNTQAVYLLATGCTTYPLRLYWVYLGYVLSMLILFLNFYIAAYLTKGGRKYKDATTKKVE